MHLYDLNTVNIYKDNHFKKSLAEDKLISIWLPKQLSPIRQFHQ